MDHDMMMVWIVTFLIFFICICYLVMISVITAGMFMNKKKSIVISEIQEYFTTGSRNQSLDPQVLASSSRIPVTVIIPVRNEVSNITACLDDLKDQDYGHTNYEVIISDDFSEDRTTDFVIRWIKDHQFINVRLLEARDNTPPNRGKKKAIERALAEAKGEIILTTDADTRRNLSWISAMAEVFNNERIRMVLGPVGFTGEKNMFQKLQTLEFLGIMGMTRGSANLGYPLMCNGANFAYRKKCFDLAGGYFGNQKIFSGDDQFLMMKFRKNFGKKSVVFHNKSSAIVWTSPSENIHDFWEQRIRWAAKSRHYNDPLVLFAALITLLLTLSIISCVIIGIFVPVLLIPALFCWLVKILADYPLVWFMADFFGKKHLLNYYFSAQLFQLFYSPLAGISGLFRGYAWKGRQIRK